jgi:hypothetical protein
VPVAPRQVLYRVPVRPLEAGLGIRSQPVDILGTVRIPVGVARVLIEAEDRRKKSQDLVLATTLCMYTLAGFDLTTRNLQSPRWKSETIPLYHAARTF